ARIREQLQVELPLRKLFEAPTVARLADGIQKLRGQTGQALPAMKAFSHPGPLRLSCAQERMWFMDQLQPDSALYNIPLAFRLKGRLDADALENAFQVLIRRHASLRTRFESHADQVFQVIDAETAFRLEIMDFSHLPDPEAEAFAQARTEAHTPFKLATGPLIRVRLLKIAADTHLLVLNLHHIVSDGWSLGLLLQELEQVYAGFCQGEAAALPVLTHQYADYAHWQSEYFASESFRTQLDYWKQQLAHAPALLQLPYDRPRPAIESYRGARAPFAFDRDLTEALLALAQREGVTPFMLLLAAFQVLLHRYSHQGDICVGIPIANRRLREVEPIVGLFVNTLVIRGDLESAPAFRDFLQQIKTRCLDAYAHQDLPFEKLVEELNPERSLSHHPLFQVMFALQDAAGASLTLAGLEASRHEPGGELSKFDLSLDLTLKEACLAGRIEYNRDLFDATTITRLLGHFEQLLQAIVAQPETPVGSLPLLTEAERQQLLFDWNQTGRDYPKDKCIHQFFEAQAAEAPERIAAVYEDQRLSYGELNERANRLAHYLRAQGVGPDVLVGLCMERSIEMIVALLGLLKAGGAYVALDPGYPRERVLFMLQDAGAKLVLAQASTAALFAGEAEVVSLDSHAEAWSDQPVTNPDSGVSLDHLISIIYTSGSTGTPKGVMNRHLGVYNHLVYRQSSYQMGPDDRIMQKTSICFDGSVWELFWPLMVGARLCFARPAGHKDSYYLCDFIALHGITMIDFVPSMLQEFLNGPPLEKCRSLRRIFVGGEGLSWQLQQEYFSKLSIALTHGYGPTETTVSVLYWECSPDSPLRTVPIGRPIANTRLYILDPGLNPVPIGVAGELHIGGDGLARGYLHRPELTAERFVPNPFGLPDQPERLYKSGDLARYLPDGNVEFLGRVDHQVKIRGFRIELGEIETLLSQHPAVQDVVVIAREDRPGDRRLVAYLVAPARPRLGELRVHLKSRLPEYMVPAAFVFLDKIPLTHNQKIDRRALPAPEANPEQTRLQADTDYIAPSSPQETALCELFAQVLKIDRVGVHDKFFDLGGHSLLATRLVSLIRERLRVELPLRSLFEAPTPAELAVCVIALEAQTANDMRDDMRIQRVSRAEPLRLSFAQERLWFMDQLEPDSALYNIPMALRLEGRLDASALEKSFTALIARHESLRTRFASRAGQSVQLIGEPFAFKLEVIDLSNHADPEAEAPELARAEAYAPFDLSAGPLLRARLLKLTADIHLLVLNLHHIISDGWSWRVMMQELEQSYAGFCQGEAVSLPELPVQYADFAHWQREWFQSEVFGTQLGYWKQQLAHAPVLLQLPTDRPRPAIDSYRGARVTFRYEHELMTALQNMAQREGVTLFMLLLAAFQVLMHRYSQQSDICVGIPIANRRLQEVEPLIGFFVNTLVIRGDLQGEPAFRDFLAQIKERCLGAYAHQDLPFEKLVEELNPKRSLSHHPLFQVLFVLQEVAPEAFALPGLQTRAEDLGSRLSRFDLAMELIPGENGLTARIEYSRDLFDDTTIARLVGHYECLLRSVLLQPEAAVASLPLLPDSERMQLLLEWNDTDTDFRKACIHQIFEELAARTPDQIALVFEEQELSYRELNEKANQLAHHLRAQGIGPEMLVGICLERSLEMVVTLLAILKAGGAYVPLDPTYPAERLAFLLQDARVGLLVTQSGLLQQLPEHTANVLCLDSEQRIFASAARQNPPLMVTPDNLAYVIYTSGSTGRPKGAMIAHRGLCNLVRAQQLAYGLTADDRVLQHASLSFDASIFEILLALCTGARLCLGKKADLLGPALHRFISRHGLTVINLPPSALAVLPPLPIDSTLKTIIVAGEACPTSLAESWSQRCRFFNAYGPTEATVWSSVTEFKPGDSQLTIGRPIANTRLYILDAELNPVPIGVPGELHIGGAGLARGYLNRPELTAEKFIPDPFSPPDRPERLYKTGDLARYLPDGNVEFLGRIDHQVKLRGFRIELGEIEALLVQHPDVRDAVVLCRGEAEHKSLIAYLVPDTSAASAELESEQVEQWQALYQETYSQNAAAEPGSDFKGWNSSYTGQPIPIGDMRQWRDATVERILSFKPVKAYEIGCGTGLLLAKIAPSCESYLASDFSAAVVEAVSDLKHRLPGLDRVETIQRRADDFTGITPQAFDTVIINSVIQYFPSAAYLLEVLRQALEATTSGGGIFIGDVRNLDLLQAFHASVTLAKAQGTESSAEIHQQVQLRVQREEELCLAPGFFYSLPALIPGIRQVEVLHKHGRFRNELNCFRYDVILHLGDAPGQNQPVSWLDWDPSFSLEDLPTMYAESPGPLAIRNIPNARVQHAVQASELLANSADQVQPDSLTALHETLTQWDASGYEPEDFWQLGETLNCRVKVCVSRAPDCFSVLLSQTDMLDVFQNAKSEDFTPDALMGFANHPVRGKVSARLVPRLKAALAEKLPEYMVPGHFVILDRFPLTPNGKIDRKALPDPDKSREQAGSEYVAPSTPEQSLLCELFAEVLELDRVGIHDNFFDLGGHSLLATQLAARIRERLQVELHLRKLFEAPTVA
ncbi:MAG: amino acid adenylation domain-containing protein, partial [Candidatus Sericytochromatia bacterium]